ncbi:HAMP domain-containing histidine kinase [Pseudomonas viridiflava]|uniref:histidine kinase n=1 Tax=Pseudomonas viridiflava TaxID=33069 RepID=A0A3M5NX01_PSEVI|nr:MULTISPECIES: HAMP domain-containing sensor histidine kinase [Pseudomonas syringae group]MBA1230398.1 HAMP domain-containing histidine kinase [Pseudomonas viridiflava]MCF5710088.1 sensor histidine kinase [Pseudomonas syringae]RMT76804.1 Sensor histidine kinase [Pseudomonas viridiflava]
MRLSEFIVLHVDRIVDEWENFARTLKPAADTMNTAELRDHAQSILLAAARDMKTAQSKSEEIAKARGEELNKTPSLDEAATSHGELRHEVGFDLVQMTSEFRHLRASVIRLWVDSLTTPQLADFRDVIRFNEAIDEALAESTAAYAERVARSRDIFLAILGHDLRAPLQAVSMSTELLARKLVMDDKTQGYISRIKTSTRHMGTMVGDLLEFVRSRLGASLPVERKFMDLANACREALEEATAGQPGSAPVLSIEGETQGHWDSGRISQMLQNLIGNALQHGAASHEITVRVNGGPDTVELVVHNEGKPIAEDAIGTIFDPLVRSSDENSESRTTSTSLGLGLFIVKEVVNAHSGSITVTSTIGDGTTFTVVLPKH